MILWEFYIMHPNPTHFSVLSSSLVAKPPKRKENHTEKPHFAPLSCLPLHLIFCFSS